MTNNSNGPWGNGNQKGPNMPEVDDLINLGRDRLKGVFKDRGGGNGGRPGGDRNKIPKSFYFIAVLAIIGFWGYNSFYSVKPEQRSVELFLGAYSSTGTPGLNFAPWPLVTREIVEVTRERTVEIGAREGARSDEGLMLTGDENIVDVGFQVVWNISDPAKYLFNLRDQEETISAVAESAMREIMARSELAPILNRDRGVVAANLRELIQANLDNYDSGMSVVRVNFDKADPPGAVINSFREVQAAEQERDRLEKQADAYSNRVLASARGEAAQLLEEAEGYRAQVVNQAEGDASRFLAVLEEYQKAPEVTRKRLHIETTEKIYGSVGKLIMDGNSNLLPILSLDEIVKNATIPQLDREQN
ncbi:MAG: FtsH protease activity modulator HflK [Rhodobacteraceae bacterium]|nr:FtsH protease activity modulator HflK [Paracoccaceae bacterium]MYF46559.1 FtsH protease activity modulator HflK [Paracoccaceae bacterium]MYI90739.1 FtsH protease activity modulator HflK [Paracoccaceae bacterium]